MEPNEHKPESRISRNYALGVLVIFAGLFLLLANMNILSYEAKHVFFSWQMLLIGIGVISLFGNGNTTPGYILIVIGGVFLVPRIFNFDFNVMQVFWPAILIAIGILILLKRMPKRPIKSNFSSHQINTEGFIHEDNIFSGGKQKVTHEFRGGQINCIFGGSEVDLTQASLGEGVNDLEVNTIFGGVTLIVPADWKIQLKMTSILGGFSDKRSYVKENPDPSRMLVIRGSTIFCGGEIKSY